MLVQIKF